MEELLDDNKVINFSWKEVFIKKQEFSSLFNVTIPAAKKKDVVLSHVVLKSNNTLINNNFFEVFLDEYYQDIRYRVAVIDSTTKESEIEGLLTSIEPGEIIKIKVLGELKKSVIDLLESALLDYYIDISIGRDMHKRITRIDLPPFTAMFFVSSDQTLPKKIMNAVECEIISNFADDEIIKLEICDYAAKLQLILTNEMLDILVNHLKDKHIKTNIRFLADYLCLHPEIKQPLSVCKMKELLHIDDK